MFNIISHKICSRLLLAAMAAVCFLNLSSNVLAQGNINGNNAERGANEQGQEYSLAVTGPTSTLEGLDSTAFSVAINPTPAAAATYLWTWSADPTAGNKPEVDFSAETSASTIVKKARWFALPNNRLYNINSLTCTYKITVTVTIQGRPYSKTIDWSVWVPAELAFVQFPKLEGTPEISKRIGANGADEWYPSGLGTLHRTTPFIEFNISLPSQFREKVTTHEERHLQQWAQVKYPGSKRPSLYNPQFWFDNVLSWITSSTSEEDLKQQIAAALISCNRDDNLIAGKEHDMAEKDAYAISNLLDPDYLEMDYD